MDVDIHLLTVDFLTQRCEEESTKKPVLSRDDRFCYELLRRAFKLEDGYALGLVLEIYKRTWSRLWIRDPLQFEQHPLTIDDFKSIAFVKVYKSLKGERFSLFPSFKTVTAYLRKTLIRTVAEYNRSAMGRQTRTRTDEDLDLSESLEQIAADYNLSEEIEKKLLWQAIEQRTYAVLPDAKDRFFFDCWAKQNYKRSEIVQEYIARWPEEAFVFNEDDVRAGLQRMRRYLLRDWMLRDLLEQYRRASNSSDKSAD